MTAAYAALVPQQKDTARSETQPAPRSLRLAAGVVLLEAAALCVTAIVLLVLIVGHTSTRLWAAFAVLGFALLAAAILALCARGLVRLRPSSRTPVVLIQLLSLPVAYSLGFQAGYYAIALPIMLAALATLALLFTTSARSALEITDRTP